MGCSGAEIWIILAVIGVLLTASRLPRLGRMLGDSVTAFKRALSGQDQIDLTPKIEAPKSEAEDPKNPDAKA